MSLPCVMLEFPQQDEWAALRAPVLEPFDPGPRRLHDDLMRQHHAYYIPPVLRSRTPRLAPTPSAPALPRARQVAGNDGVAEGPFGLLFGFEIFAFAEESPVIISG